MWDCIKMSRNIEMAVLDWVAVRCHCVTVKNCKIGV